MPGTYNVLNTTNKEHHHVSDIQPTPTLEGSTKLRDSARHYHHALRLTRLKHLKHLKHLYPVTPLVMGFSFMPPVVWGWVFILMVL